MPVSSNTDDFHELELDNAFEGAARERKSATKRKIGFSLLLLSAVGLAALGGVALYRVITGAGSNQNNNLPPLPQPDCFGSPTANFTCPMLPPTSPESIIINGTVVDSGTIYSECCATPQPSDICCDSGLNYYQFFNDNVPGAANDTTCAIGNVLGMNATHAADRALAFFEEGPYVSGFTGEGVGCDDGTLTCSYNSIYESVFPKSDKNYLTNYENIMILCAPSNFFNVTNVSPTMFGRKHSLQAQAILAKQACIAPQDEKQEQSFTPTYRQLG